MDLDFACIECEIETDSSIQLPAVIYAALRNFEIQFKESCCLNIRKPCDSCDVRAACPYLMVFARQLSPDPEIVRLHQKPSLPFSLYLSGMNGPSASCTVGLVIIGSAVNYVEFFQSALRRMVGECVNDVPAPATFALHYYCLDYQGVRHEISPAALLPASVILLSGQHILQNSVHSEHVRLLLNSPLRLLNNGSIAHRFDFATFFRSQLRRCSSLFAYYGTGKMDLDYPFLSNAARNVTVLEDDSHYTQPAWSKRLNRAGLTGTVECSGLVEPMFALLCLGSYFNAGKGAAFGLGYHKLETI